MRIFVTGVGVVSAAGVGREPFERGLAEGRSPATVLEAGKERWLGVRVPELDLSSFLRRAPLGRTGRHARFAIAASRLALEDAGLVDEELRRAALVLSSNYGDAEGAEGKGKMLWGGRRVSPHHHCRVSAASAVGWVSRELGTRGPGASLSSSSVAGSQALAQAARLLLSGEADVALAGGAEAPLAPLALGGLQAVGVLSRDLEHPALALRPFDRDRSGTVPGEGAAVLVLETEERCLRRGAAPLAELAGWGEAMDAHHPYRPSPEGRALREAIASALARAGMRAEAVERVNAHGAGTQVGDAVEARVIASLFRQRPAVTATKPVTGHLLGAAGALEAAACVAGLQAGSLPPIVGLERPDEGVDLDFVRESARSQPHELALMLSQGFGGFASALIFRR